MTTDDNNNNNNNNKNHNQQTTNGHGPTGNQQPTTTNKQSTPTTCNQNKNRWNHSITTCRFPLLKFCPGPAWLMPIPATTAPTCLRDGEGFNRVVIDWSIVPLLIIGRIESNVGAFWSGFSCHFWLFHDRYWNLPFLSVQGNDGCEQLWSSA